MQPTELSVPLGARVFVVANLLLTHSPTASSEVAVGELASVLDAWDGPGVVVFNGGMVDLARDPNTNPALALAAHRRLAAALQRFCRGGRHVVWIPGARERQALDEGRLRDELATVVSTACIADALDLVVETGRGARAIRIEPGQRFDAQDTVVPVARGGQGATHATRAAWLADHDRVGDVALLPRFFASRLLYRRVAPWSWLLLLPFLVAVAVKVPLSFALGGALDRALGPWSDRVGLLLAMTAIDVTLVAALVLAVLGRGWRFLVGPASQGVARNDAGRTGARRMIADGRAGIITGHTDVAELTDLGAGFYANAGACGEIVAERRGRFGLPPVFVPERVLSWVEIEAGPHLHVRLLHGRADTPGATLLERVVTGPPEGASRPVVVATFPSGPSWPVALPDAQRIMSVRRRAAAAIATAGLVGLASTITPPLQQRVHWLEQWMPLAVPEAATAGVAAASIALLFLSRGVRRGHVNAWWIATMLLIVTSVLHVMKGADVEEAAVSVLVAMYLIRHRRRFRAPSRRQDVRRGLGAVALALPCLASATMLSIELLTQARGPRVPVGDAFLATIDRFVGMRSPSLPHRLDAFLTPALVAITVALAVYTAALILRPVAARRCSLDDERRARSIVKRWGSGSLSYFALRADKEFFFAESSVIAYAVHNGVCLVSPDPIGPPWERDLSWSRFRAFADRHGWIIAVLGASEGWLPVYRGNGMHDLYVGDEGVIDVEHFSLDGKRNKGLRQAVNRIEKHGYRVSFHDPANAPNDLRAQLTTLMTQSRRGDVERGFSMTLGRIFDPTDEGLLLAVCHGLDGAPVAFCQYVPAPGIGGYSLDLMRRDDGEHPNGLLDFVIVETIRHLHANGMQRLGLNFAVMRAVLAGETGAGLVARVERWALRRMSGAMQIESLWRFNAKYDPVWEPRYVVYDAPEHAIPVALAVARAESFWELPLIGRFLTPPEPQPRASVDEREPALVS